MKTKTDAMINFAYFTANFTYNFIEECWKDDYGTYNGKVCEYCR